MAILFIVFSMAGVITYRFINPPITPYMIIQWWQLDQFRHQWRSLSGISPYLQQAVMVSEDQKFMDHQGFDWSQVQKAMEENKMRHRVRGASTISMQVARNVFLWQGRTWVRKGLEAYFTVLIEWFWPKWRIMEVYLNVAEWGPGVFGAESAAQYHFGISAANLSANQAAALAAVLPSPRKWSPSKPGRYVLKRRDQILRQMSNFKILREPG